MFDKACQECGRLCADYVLDVPDLARDLLMGTGKTFMRCDDCGRTSPSTADDRSRFSRAWYESYYLDLSKTTGATEWKTAALMNLSFKPKPLGEVNIPG